MQNGGSYVEKESGRGGKVEWARWKGERARSEGRASEVVEESE